MNENKSQNQHHPILFDFNGTLFWDSPYHDKTWRKFANDYVSRDISNSEMKLNVHGRTNRDILKYVFDKELSDNDIIRYTHIKESMYRELVSSKEGLFELAPGAENFLNQLIENEVPINIATSSEQTNVEFFFDHLKLSKWFDFSKVVYDDGSLVPKPAPDIFMKAAKNINQPINNCIVIEDSVAGIKSGLASNAYKVILVSTEPSSTESQILDKISGKISHFDQIYSLMN